MNKINISWDMETADPDDIFTLCLLATHPKVNLQSVTVHPGSNSQIGVVKFILNKLGINIPVGSAKPNYPKECVSQFHYNWLGKIAPESPDDSAINILNSICDINTTIVTGAALTNIYDFLNANQLIKLKKIVIQGGFAGDSVVPEEYRLEKFKGKEICPTFNLNGNIPAAKFVIESNNFISKNFVSKNVCHGIVYDNEMHERIKPYRNNNAGLNLIVEGMSFYLNKKKDGKAFHDPLAACVAISEDCCEFKEVEIYREQGQWGSRLKNDTNTFISIKCNRDKFEKVLVGL